MIQPQKVQVSNYLSKKVFTEVPRSGNDQKMKIRYKIEQKIGEQFDAYDAYDVYDMYADLANAFKELITNLKDNKDINLIENLAIKKFMDRQQVITNIIEEVKNPK